MEHWFCTGMPITVPILMAVPAPPRTTIVPVGVLLMLTSFASGCTEILSYRQPGQVFTSAMTDNAALLGLDLGQGNIPRHRITWPHSQAS